MKPYIFFLMFMMITPNVFGGDWNRPINLTQYTNSTIIYINGTNETNIWFNSTIVGNALQYLYSTSTDLGAYGILPMIVGISDSPILPFVGVNAMTAFRDSEVIVSDGVNPLIVLIRTDGGAVTDLGSIQLDGGDIIISSLSLNVSGDMRVGGNFDIMQLILSGVQILGYETGQTGMSENDTLITSDLKMGNGAKLCFDNGNLNCIQGTDVTNISVYTNQVERLQINDAGITITGTSKAGYFEGDGNQLTNITAQTVDWNNVTSKPTTWDWNNITNIPPYANVSQINTTSYLPLTGGTLTGNLSVNSGSNITITNGVIYLNGTGKVCFWGNCNNSISSVDNRNIQFSVNNTMVFNITPAGIRALSLVSTGAGSSVPSFTITGALSGGTTASFSGPIYGGIYGLTNSTTYAFAYWPFQSATATNITRYSPSLLLQSRAWNGTGSRAMNWETYISTVSLAGNPSSNYVLQTWQNLTGIMNNTQVLNITDTGNLQISGNYSSNGIMGITKRLNVTNATNSANCLISIYGGIINETTC